MKKAPYQARQGVRGVGTIPWDMHMKAYEVYSYIASPQKAMIEGGCRGGFGTLELLAFLYARSFPKDQWEAKVKESFRDFRIDAARLVERHLDSHYVAAAEIFEVPIEKVTQEQREQAKKRDERKEPEDG